jgi:hypothetical protein
MPTRAASLPAPAASAPAAAAAAAPSTDPNSLRRRRKKSAAPVRACDGVQVCDSCYGSALLATPAMCWLTLGCQPPFPRPAPSPPSCCACACMATHPSGLPPLPSSAGRPQERRRRAAGAAGARRGGWRQRGVSDGSSIPAAPGSLIAAIDLLPVVVSPRAVADLRDPSSLSHHFPPAAALRAARRRATGGQPARRRPPAVPPPPPSAPSWRPGCALP